MLDVCDLSLAYGRHLAVDRLTLCLPPGQLTALCGPNGAGKSTLLAGLAGDLVPRSGTIRLNGQDLAAMSPAAQAQARAVLEQSPSLTAAFNVRDLVTLGIPTWIKPQAAQALVTAVLAELGLAALAQRPVSALSGGQQHRAHFARALAQLRAGRQSGGGHYLLLDEPTASLDIGYQIEVMQAAQAEARSGAGVIVVLHDLNLAAAFADRIVLMQAGRLIADGRPDAMLTAARLSALYQTEIAVSEIAGRPHIRPVFEPGSAGSSRERSAHVHRYEPLSRIA
ncbi:MAG: heme ABC transporter ATP-binding protein [Rhodothalassiaceae bacterium]